MSITWYLGVSAVPFSIGVGGVLVRRNPLVILLCLELMLNAANLALVAFARAHGNQDGQIFALIVMVVAACEVAIGLGLIVALYRRAAADRRGRAAGAVWVSIETLGWLVLLFPLAGTVVIALGHRSWEGTKVPGYIGTAAIFGSFICAVLALIELSDRGEEEKQVVAVAWEYAVTGRIDAELSILIDPLSVLMMLIVSGVSALIHVYSVGYMESDRGYTRFFAYLNFFVLSMLLLRRRGELPDPDHRLGVRRRRVLSR